MGSTTCFIILFLCFASWRSEAAVFQAMGNNPDNDGCIVGSKKVAPGEDWFVAGQCERYSCHNNRGDYSGASCGVMLVPKECRLSEHDNTKTYPDCCPRMICPEENAI